MNNNWKLKKKKIESDRVKVPIFFVCLSGFSLFGINNQSYQVFFVLLFEWIKNKLDTFKHDFDNNDGWNKKWMKYASNNEKKTCFYIKHIVHQNKWIKSMMFDLWCCCFLMPILIEISQPTWPSSLLLSINQNNNNNNKIKIEYWTRIKKKFVN